MAKITLKYISEVLEEFHSAGILSKEAKNGEFLYKVTPSGREIIDQILTVHDELLQKYKNPTRSKEFKERVKSLMAGFKEAEKMYG